MSSHNFAVLMALTYNLKHCFNTNFTFDKDVISTKKGIFYVCHFVKKISVSKILTVFALQSVKVNLALDNLA